MAVPNNRYIEVRKQRDSLGRAARKVLSNYSVNHEGTRYVRAEDFEALRRAHDRIFDRPVFTAAQKRVLAGFKKARR